MGIVLGPRRLLTCAHVVNAALGLPLTSRVQPDGSLRLRFPMVQGGEERLATVERWRPVERGVKPGDMAVLELLADEPDIPVEVGYARFAHVTGRNIDGDRLRVYGMAAGEIAGQHLAAYFIGQAGSAVVQIDSGDTSGQLIRPGYSGAGVFDDQEQALVGMVQGVKVDEQQRQTSPAALCISTAQLSALYEELPAEQRRRPAWFFAAWSLLASTFFFIATTSMWVTQGGKGVIAQLAIEGEHWQIAAFFGMHAMALLGPPVAWLFWRYAGDFALSHWSRRIPPMPFCREAWTPGPRPRMSVLVVLLFVFVPIWCGGHFLIKFHREGYVYASVKDFGETAWVGVVRSDCVDDGAFCRHPKACRYMLMQPAADARGGFLNHAYMYGQQRPGTTREAVTYLPIVQPLAVIALYLVAILLLAGWLRAMVARG
jgi:hypothetical protein